MDSQTLDQDLPVWSKYSSGPTIEVKQVAKPPNAPHRMSLATEWVRFRKQQNIAFALVIAFGVEMGDVLGQRASKRRLTGDYGTNHAL